jgi:hypothetical protein
MAALSGYKLGICDDPLCMCVATSLIMLIGVRSAAPVHVESNNWVDSGASTTVYQLNRIGPHVFNLQGTVVETAQLLQCKYAAASSSKVYKGVEITPRQRLHSLAC